MRRIKRKKNPNYDLYKRYLLEKGRISKSDRILITCTNDMSSGQFTGISYRKLFVKPISHDNYGFYRMRNVDFENWVLMKQRLTKLTKLKEKIDG